MNLFSKDKEIILKITNGILLIWFLGAIIFTGNNLINTLVKEPKLTYNEYKLKYCINKNEETNEDYCTNMFDNFQLTNKDNDFYLKRNLYTSLINVIVVGSALFFINRKKIKVEKK